MKKFETPDNPPIIWYLWCVLSPSGKRVTDLVASKRLAISEFARMAGDKKPFKNPKFSEFRVVRYLSVLVEA